MIDMFLVAALVIGFYVGWNIGSNDAANAMGVAVGGRIISYRQAVSIITVFVLLGAFLEGGKVMGTVGEGIVSGPGGNPLTQIPMMAVIALLSAGVWVTVATTLGLPVSTTQSIVGGVGGAGFIIILMDPSDVTASVEFFMLGKIGVAWIIAPIAAAGFAYVLYHILARPLRRIGSARVLNRLLGILVIVSGAFVAYTLGTNDVATAMGLVHAVSGTDPAWSGRIIGLFGGLALSVGAITYSRKVMQTVGSGITRLNAMSAFVAQFGAAFIVWTFNQFGIPVSTTQAIVGGIAGVGIVKSTASVSGERLKDIVIAWILTPTVTAILTFSLGFVVLGVL